MFDSEFYPTPIHVIEMMGIDCYDKVVLEPQAGKGDIVDYCIGAGAFQVLACEKHHDLRKIVQSKCKVIADDFFTVTPEQISHVNIIVMNPPFSNAEKHVLHAYQIAPEGCEIIALCNSETLNNGYSRSRTELLALIQDYGEKIHLGDCFSKAERKTGVEISLVRIFKPKVTEDANFDDFYTLGDETNEYDALVSYNEIRAVVNTYLAAVKCFEKVEAVSQELQSFTKVKFVGKQKDDGSYETHELSFGDKISFNAGYNDRGITTKADFAKAFQRKCWAFIFDRLDVGKYVTTGVMKDINTFIEGRKNYPFSVKNISKMLDIIVGTRDTTMNKAIVEAVDNFTRHTHENRYGVEGWKTNEGHLLNKKFIINYFSEITYGGALKVKSGGYSNVDNLMDLFKALCYITGTDYSTIKQPYQLGDLKANTWYDWGFFEFKVFMKGTGHLKFKDENVWARLNQAYAKIKGVQLPETIKTKK